MFKLLVFDQLCANVALERSAHSVQSAPFDTWFYVSSLNTGSNNATINIRPGREDLLSHVFTKYIISSTLVLSGLFTSTSSLRLSAIY